MNRRICLVSGSHLSSNPRLVKEADALHAAGYDVHVIAGRNFPAVDALDKLILTTAPWRCTVVDYTTGARATAQRIARRIARIILARWPNAPLWLAARAHHPAAAQLSAAAKRVRADLYIGHTLVGLIAAGAAARHHRARLGFDAEDFHSQETDAACALPEERHSIHRLESALLPRCVHLTAAAPLIGQAYAETYGIRLPVTVQNTFPIAEAPVAPVASVAVHSPARLYWFSQSIGPGRGIESLIPVLACMSTPVELTLRGIPVSSTYEKTLVTLARSVGFNGTITVLPPAPAAEMARLAAEHDLGLALENNTPPNRDLCLTNKLYTYLLAGLPILATPTRAQSAFARDLGDAAFITDFANPAQAAALIDGFLTDSAHFTATRLNAWRLGQTKFNWDTEKPLLLSAVSQALAAPAPPARHPVKEFARKTVRHAVALALRLRSHPLTLSAQGPTLVLAPHMDDEALGCGALLAARCASGARVQVAYFTDGAAGLGAASPIPPHELARLRQNEARTAMSVLGLGDSDLHFLNAPDGGLKHLSPSEKSHWTAVLADLLKTVRPAEILLPSRSDGSSEHEAMFRLLAAAVPLSGVPVRVLEFPVWSWWNPLLLRTALRRSDRVWLANNPAHRATKAKLLRCYPTQTTLHPHQATPALTADFLASFNTSSEFIFESRLPS